MATCTSVSFGPRFHPRTAPLTFWYVVSGIAVYLLWVVLGGGSGGGEALGRALAFDPASWTGRPWSLLTHPLLHTGLPFWVALTLYVSWWLGVDCEQWWGSRVQAGFMVAMSLAMAVAMLLARAAGLPVGPVAGAAALIAGWVTIFALRGPTRIIVLIVIPCPAWLVATLTLLTFLVVSGPLTGLLAVLATSGLAAAYFYWGHKLHELWQSVSHAPARQAAREKRARDRKFKHLMVISGLADEDDEPRR